jgi:hypothetical protein
VNQERSQVRIAALRNAEQSRMFPARVLARDESQPGSDMAAILEHSWVGHFGDKRCRRERSHSAMTHQLPARNTSLRQTLNALSENLQPLLDLLQLIQLIGQYLLK